MRKPEQSRRIETVVTYLEMTHPPGQHVEPPANLKLLLVKADKIPVHFYRYLYDTVGNRLHWVDRSGMRDAELAKSIHAKGVEIFVLYSSGAPAGYFEIAAHETDVAEIRYFGLIPDFRGRGIGKWFLAEAIAAAWSSSPKRVIVDTCTLDGPAALPLYQRAGFVPYARKSKRIRVASNKAASE